MRQAPAFWHSIADSLSDDDLESLIKALTIVERDFESLRGGSVSGVIWTFYRLKERLQLAARTSGELPLETPKNSDDLADWIYKNSSENHHFRRLKL